MIFSTPSKGSTNNSSEIIPSPTFTSVPTSTPTKAPTPTKTPTPTKITLASSGNSPTAVNTRIPLEKLVDSIVPSRTKEDVLGESTLSASITPSEKPKEKEIKVLALNDNKTGKILIGISFVFFAACGIVLGVKKFKKKELIND
ncbi:MAG: hypothetical protein V1697_01075 [Candidatus Levyibacteriota bacterium]